jgi:hypothetical protein
VISGAVEHVEHQVRAIVFLDAHFPYDGEQGVDLSNNRKRILDANRRNETSTPPPTAAYFQVNRRDRSWVNGKLTPQPIGVSFQPIHLTGARDRITTKVYIRATAFESNPFNKAHGRAKRDGWRTRTIPCGHDVMIDEPEELTRLLLDIARGPNNA